MSGAAAPAVRPGRSSAPARPLTVPPHPRRVSGPARRKPAERTRQRSDQHRGIALSLIASMERLSRQRLLGGRTWIALVAFALIGIVTMQLGLLKLNAGIGRALEHEALLQRENTGLSIENSEMAASGRITSQAVRMGMESVPAGAVRFLQVRPRLDARLGAQALSTPVESTAGSAEAVGSSTTTSPTESSEASSTLPGTASQAGEPSTSAATSTPSPAEPPASESASTPTSGEAGTSRGTEEPSRGTSESASGAASGASSTTAGAPSGSAEGAPAGGTRAGSSG